MKEHENSIYIKGARVHNLRNIEVEIPHNKLVVVTGLSGSGKSTLAFDTIFAEGQRRYVESLSAYARQFLGKINKPDVDIITGIAPAIAIEQKVNTRNPRSTVGTTTEIYDYLKLLFARIGHTFSPVSGQEVRCYSVDDVATYIQELGEGSRAVIAAPLVLAEGQGIIEKLTLLLSDGLMRVYTDGQTRLIEEILPSIDETTGAADIQVVIDRMRIAPDDDTQTRIHRHLGQGRGRILVALRGGRHRIRTSVGTPFQLQQPAGGMSPLRGIRQGDRHRRGSGDSRQGQDHLRGRHRLLAGRDHAQMEGKAGGERL